MRVIYASAYIVIDSVSVKHASSCLCFLFEKHLFIVLDYCLYMPLLIFLTCFVVHCLHRRSLIHLQLLQLSLLGYSCVYTQLILLASLSSSRGPVTQTFAAKLQCACPWWRSRYPNAPSGMLRDQRANSQYLTFYRLFVLCPCVQYCLLQSAHCLSVPYNVPSVGSMSLCPLLPSTVCPLSVSTSQCTVCSFCVTVPTTAFYSLPNVCQYITLYRPLVLCHCFHCCLLQSVQCPSVPHTVPSVGSVSLCPLLPSRFCPLSVSTSHCRSVGCVSLWPLLFSTVCPQSISTSYLQSVHCLSVHHNLTSIGSVSHCPPLCVRVCPLSRSTSKCTI